MNHCIHCGTKVSQEAKFCQNCGAELKADSANKPVDANLKVAVTNETTEKVLTGVTSGATSLVSKITSFAKRLFKPVLILGLAGLAIWVIGVIVYYGMEAKKDRQREENARIEATFEVEKAIGTFQITGLALNQRFLSYYDPAGSRYEEKYSDSWPYDGGTIYNQRPTGKVVVSDDEITIYIDSNRDNKFSSKESRVHKISSISKSTSYNSGIIETDSIGRIVFVIPEQRYWGHTKNYQLHYKIGEDQYKLWLN